MSDRHQTRLLLDSWWLTNRGRCILAVYRGEIAAIAPWRRSR